MTTPDEHRRNAIEKAAEALRAVWHADAFAGHSTIAENCQYCNESAEIAYDAMEPLIRQAVAEEIRSAIVEYGRRPESLRIFVGLGIAETIVQEIGAKP